MTVDSVTGAMYLLQNDWSVDPMSLAETLQSHELVKFGSPSVAMPVEGFVDSGPAGGLNPEPIRIHGGQRRARGGWDSISGQTGRSGRESLSPSSLRTPPIFSSSQGPPRAARSPLYPLCQAATRRSTSTVSRPTRAETSIWAAQAWESSMGSQHRMESGLAAG